MAQYRKKLSFRDYTMLLNLSSRLSKASSATCALKKYAHADTNMYYTVYTMVMVAYFTILHRCVQRNVYMETFSVFSCADSAAIFRFEKCHQQRSSFHTQVFFVFYYETIIQVVSVLHATILSINTLMHSKSQV